mmetsp:Transcript_20956/g.51202  ORF Transcript_20956/g.51202 Transcript_20956/m.51202 type:complete len:221 (-) Transcript_20956:50-712(-)|eukprot:CAMPEP_0198315854 /NCGR_PEP_ID=MMETSP1450-20131203/5962_1 /TAXON_ID=753684 ORGANISM="Madagascaria erythrocladiodes, Strain CCMP3234" /NCGR_SAMPLE_ID=MMETSP1450 /ASSEMBLY_ACC=CAM_ASM_001115 /LENGTH=220 /DNA_ID=CAMNT_0044018979 /DNA_START=69 /DNA_END=731 /DNA_ORIENTATION=+
MAPLIPSVEDVLSAQSKAKTVRDLLSGRTRYTNSIAVDWWFYTRQVNPVLALFCAHELHPYTRGERKVVLFCQLSLAWALTSFELLLLRKRALRHLFAYVVAPFAIYIWEAYLRVLATCGCVQGENVPSGLKRAVEKVGHAAIGMGVLVSLVCIVLGGEVVRWQLVDMWSVEHFVVGWWRKMVLSWICALFIDTAFFWWARKREREPSSSIERIHESDCV